MSLPPSPGVSGVCCMHLACYVGSGPHIYMLSILRTETTPQTPKEFPLPLGYLTLSIWGMIDLSDPRQSQKHRLNAVISLFANDAAGV